MTAVSLFDIFRRYPSYRSLPKALKDAIQNSRLSAVFQKNNRQLLS
jgi:hypothetical protein